MKPNSPAAKSLFLLWSLRQASRLDAARAGRRAARPLAPRQGPAAPRSTRWSTARAPCSASPPSTASRIVPASDTGAVEMAMWSLLGQRGVDVLAWESFGEGWATDVAKQLKLADLRLTRADYGELPDLAAGRHRPRRGLHLERHDLRRLRPQWRLDQARPPRADASCDATSAAFAMELPWDKLDVVTWSWQKALGGEAAHGMLVLSPRAVARLRATRRPGRCRRSSA